MDLITIRNKIDAIDKEIVSLLNERSSWASEAARAKSKKGLPIYNAEREEEVLGKVVLTNHGPLGKKDIFHIYREIISAGIALEKKLFIAYLKYKDNHSERVKHSCFGSSLDYNPVRTISDVLTAVKKKDVDYGIVPEYFFSGGGFVSSLYKAYNINLVNKIYLGNNCSLLYHIKQIRKGYSYNNVYLQYSSWITRYLYKANKIEVNSTEQAIRLSAHRKSASSIINNANYLTVLPLLYFRYLLI